MHVYIYLLQCLFLCPTYIMAVTIVDSLKLSIRDQVLLQTSQMKDEIWELKTLVANQNTNIAELKALVERQNTKIAEENIKFAEQFTKLCKLESKIRNSINYQVATTTPPQTPTTAQSPTAPKPPTTTSSTVDTSSGVVFTRWGRRDCPAGISTSVYNGTVGGSHYRHTGAAVNRLCMPNDPLWDVNKRFKFSYVGYVYGGRYSSLPDLSLYPHVTPCAVCRAASFSTKVMIPGRDACYPGWTEAYNGELASGEYDDKAATEYACLDKQPQKGVYNNATMFGVWFHSVLAKCGSLPCPPYQDDALLTCVVCLK